MCNSLLTLGAFYWGGTYEQESPVSVNFSHDHFLHIQPQLQSDWTDHM